VDMEKLRKQSQHVERWEKEIRERDEALKDKEKRQKPI
jgi:hypothetical protein